MKIGILGDVHWPEGAYPRRGEPAGRGKTQHAVDSFVSKMNEIGADLVLQLGDFPATGADKIRWAREAKTFLEENLEAPVYYVMGNHEYDHGWPSPVTREVLEILGYGSTEETWHVISGENENVLILNTGFSERDFNFPEIPEAEVAWLRDTLRRIEKPTYAFMHHPLVGTTGDRYDEPTRMGEARELLESDPNVILCSFGHMHHDPEWWRAWMYAKGWFHVPPPSMSPSVPMRENIRMPGGWLPRPVAMWAELTAKGKDYGISVPYCSDLYRTAWGLAEEKPCPEPLLTRPEVQAGIAVGALGGGLALAKALDWW